MLDHRPCPSCGAPAASGQRYCLSCGRALVSALGEIRAALAGVAGLGPARPHPRRRLQRAGTFSGMLAGGLAIGILAGGLVAPSGQSLAAPVLEVLVPRYPPAAAAATTAPAAVVAGAPVAAPQPASGSGSSSAASTGAATTTTTTTTSTTTAPTTMKKKKKKKSTPEKLPKIRHVWLVVLSDQSYAELYGPKSKAHYLNHSLVPNGTLLSEYHATAHGALADGIALLSGQGPTPQLQADCPLYESLEPGRINSFTGQARGRGCVFPATVSTLADQFAANRLTWRAYIGGQTTPPADQTAPVAATTTTLTTTTPTTTTPTTTMTTPTTTTPTTATTTPTATATTPTTTTTTPTTTTTTPTTSAVGACSHPQLGATDPSAGTVTPPNDYATWRNPFMYFHSVIDSATCATSNVGLDQLATDLAANQVPNFSWIAPDLCAGGAAGACPAGAPASGAAAADVFLSEWIPKIEATTAYQRNGMIVIVSDQAPASGRGGDSTACCGTIHYPNTRNAGGQAEPGAGGGRTGALVISPFAAKGVIDPTPADHFTVLRTIEDLFNFPYLGYAEVRKDFDVKVFPQPPRHATVAALLPAIDLMRFTSR